MTAKLIRVINLLGSALVTDTNLATDTTTEWNTGSITAGDIRKVTTTANGASVATYKIYEALTSHTSKDPTAEMDPDNALYVSPGVGTNWKETGSVAEWAWASNVYQDQSTKNGSWYIEVTPGQRVDSIYFGNLDASSLTVVVESATYGTLYNSGTVDLTLPRGLGSWLRWFTEPFANKKDYTIFGIPTATDAVITITIDKGSNDASAGAILLGQALDIGEVLYGAGFGADSYTRAEYLPSSGRTLVTPRNYSRTSDVNIAVESSRFQALQQQLLDRLNQVSVFVAQPSEPATAVMGILERYRTVIPGPRKNIINLRVKAVT